MTISKSQEQNKHEHFHFLIINGPNINFLGIREKNIYGSETYQDLIQLINDTAKEKHWQVDFYQSNHEGDIVDKIQEAYFAKYDGIVINPAAYTHTSVAILDALKAVAIPTVEVHISNPKEREDFRKISYVEIACIKTIAGQGFKGYLDALYELEEYLKLNSQ